jgi:uncharacterized protein YjcR
MAKARSPNRDKAFTIWQKSGGKMPLKEIAAQLAVSDTQIRKWKNIDQWDAKLNSNVTIGNSNVTNESNSNVTIRKPKTGAPYGNHNAAGHGAPKGNKNAVGNSGGAPARNTNAVSTGEYQTIWLDVMDADEQAMFASISTDPLVQIDEDIRLLTYRERRMLTYLNDLKAKKELSEQKDVYAMQNVPVITEVYDEMTGKKHQERITQQKKILVEQTQTTKMLIDKILRVEEALTRVQEKKIRAIESKHRIMNTNSGSTDEPIEIHIRRKESRDAD